MYNIVSMTGLSYCSLSEAWGQQNKPESLSLSNEKTKKKEVQGTLNPQNNKKISVGQVDRFSEDHNGPLRKSKGPSAANASIRGIKPMEYGSSIDNNFNNGNLNPFFNKILEDYKKENVELKNQIEKLKKDIKNLSQSKSTRGNVSNENRKHENVIKTTKPVKNKISGDSKSYTLSHVPFDMEPEVFNIFMFSFFAIIFLLFIDKTLSGKGIKLF